MEISLFDLFDIGFAQLLKVDVDVYIKVIESLPDEKAEEIIDGILSDDVNVFNKAFEDFNNILKTLNL